MQMMLIIEKKITNIPFLLPEQFLDNLNHLLNNDTKDIPNFLLWKNLIQRGPMNS